MALYTRLSDQAVGEIAARFALGPVAAWQGIAAGTVNSNYRVEAGGRSWFVRVNEGKSEEDVAWEVALLAHLQAHGVATPPPAAGSDGTRWARVEGSLVTVFPWQPGAHRAARALAPEDAHACGLALAQVHRAGADFAPARPSRYAFDRIVERWRRLAVGGVDSDPEVRAAIATAGEELDWLHARAEVRVALPQGIIHGDLFPDNVLFDGPVLAALLDFEQASSGTFAYDLAVCLAAWAFGDDFDPARARALFAGYQQVRLLGSAEREGLWVEARAAAVRFTVTRLTDVRLNPDASELLKRTKDYRRYLRRLLRLRELGPSTIAAWLA